MPSFSSNTSRKGHPQNIEPEGEFCLPVLLPDDPEWVAMFLGALERLGNRSTWDYDDGGDYVVVSDRWKQIARETANAYQAALSCAVEAPEEGDGCLEIGAFHPAISYYPNHPILSPGETGPYVHPIWGTGAGYIGATDTDAMIDPLGFLGQTVVDIINGGIVPTAELSFNGSGEIDVHLIQTVQGGAVWIFPDGNPLLGDLVSLSFTDLTELLGVETLIDAYEIIFQADLEAFVRVHTVNFETEGDHTLTMWFFPTVDPEPPFVGSGGGLRAIQLCGNATLSEDIVVPYTIELDGDSLNLLADGAVVSEISKATLQSFLDRWVDTTGDTMTATLTHELPDVASDEYYNTGDLIGQMRANSTGMMLRTYGDREVELRNEEASGARVRVRDKSIFFIARRDFGLPPVGSLRFSAYNEDTAAAFLSAHATGDIVRFYQSTALRASLIAAGKWRGAAYEGWDYSSSATWRSQFMLQGSWGTSTDAIRRGRVDLKVSGYDGDVELMAGEYGDDVTELAKLGFFGTTPNKRQPFTVTSQEAAFQAALDQLAAYGLIDINYPTPQPEITATYDAAQRCTAAYYVANSLAALIQDVFENIDTITTTEVLTGLIETYNIPANAAQQIILAAITDIANEAGILADLVDPSSLAIQLQICDFEQDCFFDWLDAHPSWVQPTIDVVKAVLSAVWDTVVPFWLAVGALTPDPDCEDTVLGCSERYTADLRYGVLHGWELVQGSNLGMGGGIQEAYSSEDELWQWSIRILIDNCRIWGVNITMDLGDPKKQVVVFFQQSDGMGGFTSVSGPHFGGDIGGSSVQTFDVEGNEGPVTDRITVFGTNWASFRDSRIFEIEVIPWGLE